MKKTAMQKLWDWIDANINEDNFNIFDAMRLSLEEEKKEHERIYDHAFGYGVKSSQTEISDEEITKLANEHILYNDSKRQWVIEGMKLYREQLKTIKK